jgi:hypothetical protein
MSLPRPPLPETRSRVPLRVRQKNRLLLVLLGGTALLFYSIEIMKFRQTVASGEEQNTARESSAPT